MGQPDEANQYHFQDTSNQFEYNEPHDHHHHSSNSSNNTTHVYYEEMDNPQKSRNTFCCVSKLIVGGASCVAFVLGVIFFFSYIIYLSQFAAFENDNVSNYDTSYFVGWNKRVSFDVSVSESQNGYVQLKYDLAPDYSTSNDITSMINICFSGNVAELGVSGYAQPGIPPSTNNQYDEIVFPFTIPTCNGDVSNAANSGIAVCANATIYILVQSTNASPQNVTVNAFYGNCFDYDCVCDYLIGGLSLAVFFALVFVVAQVIACCCCCVGCCFCGVLGCIMIYDSKSKNRSESHALVQYSQA